MINRRSVLKLIAALPFIGSVVPGSCRRVVRVLIDCHATKGRLVNNEDFEQASDFRIAYSDGCVAWDTCSGDYEQFRKTFEKYDSALFSTVYQTNKDRTHLRIVMIEGFVSESDPFFIKSNVR